MKNVYKFNQKRNGFVLDETLEYNMLNEELDEFYAATSLAERIDAFMDVTYVYDGTIMKFNKNRLVVPEDITKVFTQFRTIAKEIIIDELGDLAQHFDKIMDKAWNIVCECNADKLSELDENGKVMKQDNLRNATEEIAEMLEQLGYGARTEDTEQDS